MTHYDDATPWRRLAERELNWCLRFNRIIDNRGLALLFAAVSRLGDGMIWYALLLALPATQGGAAWPAVGRMALVGLLALLLYKWLKAKTGRPRPCARRAAIRLTVPPLDEYSFPSGHTLHAVAFSSVAIAHYPRLAWLLVPFTGLVAVSRLALGLHYPSDVLAGALLGFLLAALTLQW